MLTAVFIVTPIFALILVGWVAGRAAVLGSTASTEINKFVVWIAVPALLFDVISSARLQELSQFGFIGAFGLSTIIVFAVAVTASFLVQGDWGASAIDGLNAAYSNIGYVGLPLMVMVLGKTSIIFTTLALLVTMCVVFAVAIAIVELAQHSSASWREVAVKVSTTLIRNPILISSLVALPFPLLGWTVPAPAKVFLDLLGASASPCALVALGLFLAQSNPESRPASSVITLLVLGKLAIHPLLAWLIGTYVFALIPSEIFAVTLLAALPAGTGAFMLAGFYQRDASVTTFTIIVSTMVSVVTLSALISVQQGGSMWH